MTADSLVASDGTAGKNKRKDAVFWYILEFFIKCWSFSLFGFYLDRYINNQYLSMALVIYVSGVKGNENSLLINWNSMGKLKSRNLQTKKIFYKV